MVIETLQKYKEITESIINEVRLGAEVEDLFNSRKLIIDELLLSDKEAFKLEYFQLGLDKLDMELGRIIREEQALVKEELQKINMSKAANKVYSNNMNRLNFFNKEI